MELIVSKSPTESLALTNSIIVHPSDFSAAVKYIRVNGKYLFTIRRDATIQKGHAGTAVFHRSWAGLSLNQIISVEEYDPLKVTPNCYLDKIVVQVGFAKRSMSNQVPFNTDAMASIFCQSFQDQIFSLDQCLAFDFQGVYLSATVSSLECVNAEHLKEESPKRHETFGILVKQTAISFLGDPDSGIKLQGNSRSNMRSNAILKPDFKFEAMGIGGLDEEFSTIFRRVFASRIFPADIVERLGISHVRGLLLYGPPGTGKTLLARQIGSVLNAREPKIVNGPEILNKYVGQSEENVRNLFKDAEAEYRAKGEDSQLHIIIFDELDAICKQRGSRNDGTGVGDSVVNQLLSKLDGVDSLNNILVIGMTNRLDLIDEALLRPGRLEVQMEIGLPSEQGRLQILKIHTQKMRDNHLLESDVDLEAFAKRTPNFSGAELAGLVKAATSFAFNRHVKVGNLASVSEEGVKDLQVTKTDFELSLADIPPAFGVAISDIESLMENGFIVYSDAVQKQLDDLYLLVKQVQYNQHTHLISVFVYGPPGSGKSTLASKIAIESGFPFIKLLSPDLYIGMNEVSKSLAISKVFQDSYRSPHSLILLDDVEKLVDYAPIGPRYSNQVLQTLMILLKKSPPSGRKLLVLCTSSCHDFFEDVGLIESCSTKILVSCINHVANPLDVCRIVETSREFSSDELSRFKDLLLLNAKQISPESGWIGIKKLYYLIRMAEEAEPVEHRMDRLFKALVETASLDTRRFEKGLD